VFDEILLIF